MSYDELEALRQKAGAIMDAEGDSNAAILAAIIVKIIRHIQEDYA